MNELSALAGSEGYEACGDESPASRTIQRTILFCARSAVKKPPFRGPPRASPPLIIFFALWLSFFSIII